MAVGSSVADELERLGFEIAPVDHNTAKATKDGKSLNMTIATAADDKGYDGINDEAVVVEMWIAE